MQRAAEMTARHGGPLAVLAACMALAAGVCQPSPAATQPHHDSKQDEAAPDLGVNAYLGHDVLVVDSAALDRYLQQLLAKLVATAKHPMAAPRVVVVSNDEYYAEADAYGNLVLYTGVLRRVKDESELCAVLGHELGHLMLDHVKGRASAKNLPLGIESLGALSAAADQLHGRTPRAQPGGAPDLANHGFYYSLGASVLVEDLLMPAYNRGQERDADRVAVDLLGGAGYDVGAMTAFLTKVGAAHAERSKRLDALRLAVDAEAKKKAATTATKAAATGTDPLGASLDQAMGAAAALAATKLTGLLADAVASRSVAYDPAETRIAAVLKYRDDQHAAPSAKRAADNSAFNSALHAGHGGAVLDEDRASIEARAALDADQLSKAQQIATRIPVASGGNPKSAHLNLALASVYARAQQHSQAEARLDGWLRTPLAPSMAYLQKAAYLYQRRHFKEAEQVLRKGAERLNAWSGLLPYLVTASLAQGDTAKAEDYTRQCAELDHKSAGLNPLKLLSNSPGPLYAQCRARLGHDPPKQEGGSNPLSGAIQGTKHLFDKLKPD